MAPSAGPRRGPFAGLLGGSLRGLWGDLLDLVLPEVCAGCSSARGLLCEPCRRFLDRPARPSPPVPAPAGLPPAWAGPEYDGAARAAIIAYKESGRTGLAAPLGAVLARTVAAAAMAVRRSPRSPRSLRSQASAGSFWPPGSAGSAPRDRALLLVPAPSAAAALRRRGHDPVRGLADAAVTLLARQGAALRCAPVLAQARRVADQAGLPAVDRAGNLRGALAVTAPHTVAGRQVIVVDDVITTGATLTEAARALREAGADVLGAAVVAATRRRFGGDTAGRPGGPR